MSSRIFLPSRALGYVSNHVPLNVRYIKRRKENLIVTCVGRSFHTYGCSHFSLLSVSGLHPGDITCISSDAFLVFAASENNIYAWRRGTELKHTYKGHTKPIHLMLPFGPHIISVDEDSLLKVWDIKSEDLHLELTFNNDSFRITTILHPSTYLNKVLLGSEQGHLQLWNISTLKLVYTFKGWGTSITVLEQAPAMDVVAIGLSNGQIFVHNLKFDETLMDFSQDHGPVTGISFRTDGYPIMTSASTNGNVVMWNLEERKVASQLLCAHNDAISGFKCLPNEPLLLTSSIDNTLKLWIFDMTDGGARLLRFREGHASPPLCIRFHGATGQNILSAGLDSSLRIFNTVTETFNKSMGKASYNRKASKKKGRLVKDTLRMPPICDLTSETTREKEWNNIVAIHIGLPMATTWSYDKVCMGEIKLLPDRFTSKSQARETWNVSATSLCLTHCGNFVVIGYSSGHVDRFNVQSGIHRWSYGAGGQAHTCPVRGVHTDSLNQVTVTAGSNGTVKFWPFKDKYSSLKPLHALELCEQISFIRAHRESSMFCVALEDFSMCIIDLDNRTLVRKFVGHMGQITDATFSPDSRWLITAAMDCTIKTWDIPSGQLIDHFQVKSACTSLTFSPVGDFLATSHVDYLGLFLWSNRTLYSHVSLRALSTSSAAPVVDLPTSSHENAQRSIETSELLDLDEEPEFKTSAQINEELITLSELSTSRWQNLLNIDVIKKRNKPKAAFKAPKSAPFFLPTIPNLQMQFDLSDANTNDTTPKLANNFILQNLSPFGKILKDTIETDSFENVVAHLKQMGPSLIDFEINSLCPEGGGSLQVMVQFIKTIGYMLQSNRNFELAQAYLGVFLKGHGKLIAENKQMRNSINNLQQVQHKKWSILQKELFYNLSVIQSLKQL